MTIKTEDMELFIAIIEAGNITKAADNLGMAKSNVSRRIKQLEESLGTRLLERTTRSLALTEAGNEFYLGCQELLDGNEILQRKLTQKQNEPTGRLSVFAPQEFLGTLLRPHLNEFSERYPNIKMDFLSGAAKPHLLHDNIDVMIHVDDPQDSSYIARKLLTVHTACYASPGYLKAHGSPQTPEDVSNHPCIMELSQERQSRPWRFTINSKVTPVDVKPQYRSDSTVFVRILAEQGLGLTVMPNFACQNSVEKGLLVKVFKDEYDAAHSIYAIYASKKLLPEKMVVFLDFLKNRLPDSV